MKTLAVAFLAILMPAMVVAQQAPADDSSVDVTLRRMQLMLHHAVEIAAEGASLAALADPAQPSAVDELAMDRGKKVIAEARDLIQEVAAGDAMTAMHAMTLTDAQSTVMIRTHQLEQAATRYIDVTEELLLGGAESR